jgi:hypothetical protein
VNALKSQSKNGGASAGSFHRQHGAETPNSDTKERIKKTYWGNPAIPFHRRLSRLQASLPVIAERGEIIGRDGKVQGTYALWEDINEALRPLLSRHGFALTYRTGNQDRHIVVTCVLSHNDGHSEQTSLALPADLTGGKNAVQAIGSLTSYGKRYTACALLNITTRGEDDDGASAGLGPSVTAEDVAMLRELIREANAEEAKLLALLKVDSLEALPATKLDTAVQALNARKGRR